MTPQHASKAWSNQVGMFIMAASLVLAGAAVQVAFFRTADEHAYLWMWVATGMLWTSAAVFAAAGLVLAGMRRLFAEAARTRLPGEE